MTEMEQGAAVASVEDTATDTPAETEPQAGCRIVAIGASAGGLEPFETFFENVRVDTGFAFVVIQHLSPHFRSMMDELLDRRSSMRIERVTDGMRPEPNVIYLNPARVDLELHDGRFSVGKVADDTKLHLPINTFFSSLAAERGEDAVAIVLSGTGTDGTLGAEAVRAAGGTVLIQDPETSKFDGMPTSVLDNMTADAVAPPKELASLVARLADGEAVRPVTLTMKVEPKERVYRLLRDRFATDFSQYKSTTIDRRLSRRAELSDCATLEKYADLLENDDEEADALYADFLIEVTEFFRDRSGFDSLSRHVIPPLAELMDEKRPLRVWVPGCASGEEAYSIAILLAEHARENGLDLNLKIIATDIHHRSLEAASAGRYGESAVKGIPRDLLERYFVQDGTRWRVHPTIQGMVVFSVHDILGDPPFTRIDMVSCRNLLIYLNESAQQKALSYFHFALNKGGYLFLGPSETVGALSDEFECLDHRWHIFRKRRDARLAGVLSPAKRRSAAAAGVGFAVTPPDTGSLMRSDARRMEEASLDILLRRYAPPGFLLRGSGEVVRVFGDAGRFVDVHEGRFSQRITDLVRADLRSVVGAAIDRIRSSKSLPFERRVRTAISETERMTATVTLEAVADRRADADLFLLTIHEDSQETPAALLDREDTPVEDFETVALLRQTIEDLEHELQGSEETLQTMIEELGTSNEELQATNEELMASNEELQSTNEELHSVNEELYTVSAEHQRKIIELTEMSGDMEHLLKATGIGTIFIDAAMKIRRFTPAASRAFNILDQDVGRPIVHITNRFGSKGIERLLETVIESGEAAEEEFRLGDAHMLLRILPYVAAPGEVSGAVLTTIDVTDLKQAQTEAQQLATRYGGIVEDMSHFILRWGATDRVVRFCNRAYCEMTGRDEGFVIGHPLRLPLPGGFHSSLARLAAGETKGFLVNAGGGQSQDAWYEGTVRAIRGEDGEVAEYQAIGQDVTTETAYRIALEKISRLRDDVNPDFDATLEDLLRIGADFFGMPLGIVSRIEDDRYDVRVVVGGEEYGLESGATMPLDRTYCRYLADNEGLPVAIHHVAESDYARIEPHEASGFEAYIGQKIRVGERVVGAVNFASPRPRPAPFDDLETDFIVILAEWIGRRLERSEAMETIRRAKEDLQLVIDNVRAVIFYKDDKNRILRLNEPAASSMGMTVEDATGADTYELFPEAAAKYHEDDLKVIESGEPLYDIIEMYTPKDGRHSWIRTDKIPYVDPQTGERNILVIAMDITALKEQEERLSELNVELEGKNARLVSANDSLQQFAHVASHDLQEPLRKLMQFTEYLEQDCGDELSEDGRYFVDVISKSATRMRQLVRDILLLSSASGKELDSAPIDLAETMRSVRTDLEASIRESGATIEIGDLPVVSGDSTLVDQLFRNLVSNALKYRRKDAAPNITIEARASGDGGGIEIMVADDGIGMKPENTARIFEPFTRLHDRKEYAGTGIGLAICRTVCERHNWTIRAESAPEEGTAFFVCIPTAHSG